MARDKTKKNLGGRPPSDDPKRNRVTVVFTDGELSEVTEAARAAEVNRLTWMRTVLLKEARKKRKP